jgi:diguanylate cyclase (GGDEF)-like protein/PAS domain S-box-containing protein
MPQRVLLIQDDARSAKGVLKALSAAADGSFQVDWIRRSSEALEQLSGVAAILLELDLPDSRGIETFNRIHCAAPRIPILILIDPQNETTAKLAVQCGAQDYLIKTRLDAYMLPRAVASMIERTAAAEALFEQNERAQITLNSIGDAVVSTDASGQVRYLNAIAETLTGWTREQALGHPLEEILRIVDGTTREPLPNPMTVALLENRAVSLTPNCVLIRRDGTEAAIEDSAAPIHDRHGAATGAVMIFRDVSVARAMNLKLSYLAQHDGLTDLPNRVLLNDRLNEAISLSSRYERQLALLFLDLDRFKHINDSLGHVLGDRLLQSVARRLFTCVRSSDTVSRLGGDEFVVLLWEVRQGQDAAITAEKILQALREPHRIDHHVLHITGSIGIVTFPDDGADAETLMKKADVAMYHAKGMGRDTYQFFRSGMNTRAVERQSLEDSLRHALERNELLLHYQPKVNLSTGAIIGVEALVRWRHPERGLVAPEQFIAIAEDSGLIVPIGRWVLHEACRQARAWQVAGLAPTRIAINVSAVELRAPGFVSGIRTALAETGLDPRSLELELTETVLIEKSRTVADVLRELKEIGVLLALDDFGTGYSSLSYLKRFPIDTVKIDRSFVSGLTTPKGDVSIVAAVIGMGKSLHIPVLAEGVETRQQLEILQEQGCAQAQGYYFSRPVPAAAFGGLLKRGLTAEAFA